MSEQTNREKALWFARDFEETGHAYRGAVAAVAQVYAILDLADAVRDHENTLDDRLSEIKNRLDRLTKGGE